MVVSLIFKLCGYYFKVIIGHSIETLADYKDYDQQCENDAIAVDSDEDG